MDQSPPEQTPPESKPSLATRLQNLKGLFSSNPIPRFKEALLENWASLKSRPRLYISILGGIGFLFLLIMALVAFSVIHHKNERAEKMEEASKSAPLERLVKVEQDEEFVLENLPTPKESASKIPLSNEEKINELIKKADLLYNQGQIEESLQIFHYIAQMSSSIANHNLGVIQMRQQNYTEALRSFDRAIAAQKNTSVSSIDAMAAAFYLNNMDLYTRYLKLTMQNLHQLEKQPIYSYVYSLGLYYGGHYFEALSSLTNPNSELFRDARERLSAKMFLVFGDANRAIYHLEPIAKPKDFKALGLLYARTGDYSKALEYLHRYNSNYPKDMEALLAMQIIAMKVGDLPAASSMLDLLLHGINKDKQKEKILSDTYPIKPILNPHFFDINMIRRDFWQTNFRGSIGLPVIRILFYYAPFKLVESKKALGSIQEGVFFVDTTGKQDFDKAITLLQKGKNIGIADQHTIMGLRDLSKWHLRAALHDFKQALEANPNSATSHYNIGLIYAQLEDYHSASFHFKKAYYLDNGNVLGGIFAVLAAKLAYEDPAVFLQQLTKDFQNLNFHDSIQHDFLSSFIGYLNGANNDDLSWIKKAHKPMPIYYALNIAYANKAEDKQRLVDSFVALKKMYPNNMLTNIFYEMMLKYRADIKQMLGVYAYLTSKEVNLEELFHGPLLARKMFIYMGFITGLLGYEEELLSTRLSTSQDQNLNLDLMRMLALTSIFQKKYQKAASILNYLVDKLDEKGVEPLALASLANIALGRFGDAALYLEIAKTMYPGDYDVRYGLGLLYQRAGNLEASLNSFRGIKSPNFHSGYFDFQIKAPTNQEDFPWVLKTC